MSGSVFFAADDGTFGRELWLFDPFGGAPGGPASGGNDGVSVAAALAGAIPSWSPLPVSAPALMATAPARRMWPAADFSRGASEPGIAWSLQAGPKRLPESESTTAAILAVVFDEDECMTVL